jgi:hypothetical protein
METLTTQGMRKATKADYVKAVTAMTEWAATGASNRFARDAGNVAMFTIALVLADDMRIAPARLAERRDWVRSGKSAITADWDALVPGASRPDQKCQRRLMSALALRGKAVRLDWVNVDGTFYLVRTA